MRLVLLLALLAVGCSRSGPLCPALQKDPTTYTKSELAALPEVGSLKAVHEERSRSPFNEHAAIEVQAELGPLRVDYEVWDYKGQRVTAGRTASIRAPACANESFKLLMTSESTIRLRHDTVRDLWIVSNLDDPQGAVVLRRLAGR
ncbi:MAG: hypothetical protein HY898_18225 [Deltaproteobacteria bacterium]|nr:hypothetical protein [Deltaproteobacteria bacterium]